MYMIVQPTLKILSVLTSGSLISGRSRRGPPLEGDLVQCDCLHVGGRHAPRPNTRVAAGA